MKTRAKWLAPAALAAVFGAASGCTMIAGSELRVNSLEENSAVDVARLVATVDDFRQRHAAGSKITESEVIETFARTGAYLTVNGRKTSYNELFDTIHRGARPQTPEDSAAFHDSMADVRDYVLVCRNVATYGQVHYTTEIQTRKTGFDYSVQVVFKGGHLMMIADSGRPNIDERDSEIPVEYVIKSVIGGAKAAF